LIYSSFCVKGVEDINFLAANNAIHLSKFSGCMEIPLPL